nr:ATP-dependent helicase [Bacilli bacterium]
MTMDRFQFLVEQHGVTFTSVQREAIEHGEGPAIVFAGPGSGKTTVITWRALYLVIHHGVSPSDLVIFTFTKKSANELKNRLIAIDPRLAQVQAGTFHSLFLRWLMKHHLLQKNICNEKQQRELVKQALKQLSISQQEDTVRLHLQAITLLKNSMIHYDQLKVTNERFREIQQVYQSYEMLKNKQQLIDYDDLLLDFEQALHHSLSFRKALIKTFSYIMVDEFQDTSKIQWLGLQKLAYPQANLMVVGDDDQSIYRFRGAMPEVITSFHQVFPQAKELILGHNFRSTDTIIAMSSALIEHNVQRKSKQFVGSKGGGPEVTTYAFANEWEEARKIAQEVSSLSESKTEESIAILARTNRQLLLLVDELLDRKIPMSIDDQQALLFHDEYVQIILTILLALRHESANYQPIAMKLIEQRFRILGNTQSAQEVFQSFTREPFTPAKLIPKIRSALALHGKSLDRFDKVALLEEKAIALGDLERMLAIAKEHQLTYENQADSKRVMITTFHGSKGLEFDTVFLIGLHEQAMPHHLAFQEGMRDRQRQLATEEERRLLYVAMTRAKKQLMVSFPYIVQKERVQPSPFLTQIGLYRKAKSEQHTVVKQTSRFRPVAQEALPAIDDCYRHKIFGFGYVKSVEIMSDKSHKVGIVFNKDEVRFFHWETVIELGHVSKVDELTKERT